MTNQSNKSDIIYDSFKKWSNKNWKDTLGKHSKEIEEFFMKLNTLDIWSNLLQDTESNRNLIPEIFIDAYMGLLNACQGLYKYAFICLRSQLEITLRVIYFSTHPVEYSWWFSGDDWYLSRGGDVWGRDYEYFKHIDSIRNFNNELFKKEQILDDNSDGDINGSEYENLISINSTKKLHNKQSKKKHFFNDIKKTYKQLSKYVHSEPHTFQSKDSMISPSYSLKDFKYWIFKANKMLEYINLLFTLGFEKKFQKLSKHQQNKILNNGISNLDYKNAISEIYGLTDMVSSKKTISKTKASEK